MTTTQAITAAAIMAVAVLLPTPSAAQLNGDNIKGDAGLKSGSQAPPGAYVAVPLWFYTADAVKDRATAIRSSAARSTPRCLAGR